MAQQPVTHVGAIAYGAVAAVDVAGGSRSPMSMARSSRSTIPARTVIVRSRKVGYRERP